MNNPLLILLVATLSAAGLSLALFAVACLAKFLNDMQADARSEEAAARDGGAKTSTITKLGSFEIEVTKERSVNSGAGEFSERSAA